MAEDKSTGMDKEKSQEINEQIQYGLKNIHSEKEVSLSLKDFLYTYKAIQELRRFFHQPLHYPTLIELNNFIGNSKSGAYSILNDLYLRTLDKYLPEDIIEEIENGDKLNHPDYPFYCNLRKSKKFNLSAAGNTEPPAFELIKEMGFEMSKKEGTWIAENYNTRFNASSPLELLGLIALYQAKGEQWQISDEKIEQFIEFNQK